MTEINFKYYINVKTMMKNKGYTYNEGKKLILVETCCFLKTRSNFPVNGLHIIQNVMVILCGHNNKTFRYDVTLVIFLGYCDPDVDQKYETVREGIFVLLIVQKK